MWSCRFAGVAAIALVVSAEAFNYEESRKLEPDRDGKYWIYGDNMSAAFIPYGAAIANLLFKDQYGVYRDVVGGFDNASYYSIDKQHPHFGSVPGRYANRIKNSTFEIDGQWYKVDPNDNPTKESPTGVNTIHGGPDGWDWRNFTVVAHTDNSVTFSIHDPDAKEGFPGDVVSAITYTLSGQEWHIKMVAQATTKKTPIMLTSHAYWNLDGFANNETNLVLDHTLHMPYCGQRVGVDNILIPTGEILPNIPASVNDFWTRPKRLGEAFGYSELNNNCGLNCTGYDNCFIINRDAIEVYDWRKDDPVVTLSSVWSGIKVDVFTNQHAVQVYTCNSMNGTIALKETQGVDLRSNSSEQSGKAFPRTIPQHGCVALEVQDYIDGINHPEWMRKQIFGPTDQSYVLEASYKFSHVA